MKILLICNEGMSTSIIVQKMQMVAEERGLDIIVEAKPYSVAARELNNWDVVLLGPQVKHQYSSLKNSAKDTPIAVIDMRDYGRVDGERILEQALSLK